jgi:hypothetical protein
LLVTAGLAAVPPVQAAARACTPARVPADVLDLSAWSVTLPRPASPVTVKQPDLATYTEAPDFVTRGCAVQLLAPVTAGTTPNSRYPRAELREMAPDGRRKAAWSSGSGRHELDVDLAFTRLPAGKPHVVGAQVHDAGDDVATLRLEGTKLWITHRDDSHAALVTAGYRLGTRVRMTFVVADDVVRATVDGRPVAAFPDAFDGGYFKAGAYTQANCTNSAPCDPSNAGAVLLYGLRVQHS